MCTSGGCEPGLTLRLGQLERVSQQPDSVIARRPHAAGLKVAHRALAQFGAFCQLLL